MNIVADVLAQGTGTAPAPVTSVSDLVHILAGQIDFVGIIFTGFVLFLFIMMARWQFDAGTSFDIRDAFMKNGHVSRDALFEWVGVVSLTFVLIHQEFKDELTDWYVVAYSAAVLAKGLTNIVKGAPSTKPPEESK